MLLGNVAMTTAVLFWTSAIILGISDSVSSSTTDEAMPKQTGSSCNSTSSWTLNSTTDQNTPHGPPPPPAPPSTAPPTHHNGLAPIIGYPGPLFTAIHSSALASLSLSSLSVSCLLIYLCCISGSVKEPGKAPPSVSAGRKHSRPGDDNTHSGRVPTSSEQQHAEGKKKKAASASGRIPFPKWNVGERFVIYLGVCDLLEEISHFLDHAYMLYAKDSPPDQLCTIFAFFLHDLVISQWLIVVASAVSASSLIVFGRKMSLGRRDWRLIAFAFGVPLIMTVTACSLGLLGASGAWCMIKYGADNFLVYTQFFSILQISLFGTVGLAYGAIWVKIQRTTKLMNGSTSERYQNSARVMMIFVAAFIVQWGTFTLYGIWSLLSVPPAIFLVIIVIFTNLGGIINCVAYTIIRRRLQRQNRQSAAVTGNVNEDTTVASTINSYGAQPPPRLVSAPGRPIPAAGGQPVGMVGKAWSVPVGEGGSSEMALEEDGENTEKKGDGVGPDKIENTEKKGDGVGPDKIENTEKKGDGVGPDKIEIYI